MGDQDEFNIDADALNAGARRSPRVARIAEMAAAIQQERDLRGAARNISFADVMDGDDDEVEFNQNPNRNVDQPQDEYLDDASAPQQDSYISPSSRVTTRNQPQPQPRTQTQQDTDADTDTDANADAATDADADELNRIRAQADAEANMQLMRQQQIEWARQQVENREKLEAEKRARDLIRSQQQQAWYQLQIDKQQQQQQQQQQAQALADDQAEDDAQARGLARDIAQAQGFAMAQARADALAQAQAQAQPPTQSQTQSPTKTLPRTQDLAQQQQTRPLSPIIKNPNLKIDRRSGINVQVPDDGTSTPVGQNKAPSKSSFTANDPFISPVELIDNLVVGLRDKAGPIIFQSDRFLNMKYLHPSAERPHQLYTTFEQLFTASMKNFTRDARIIISAYLDSCAQVFDSVADQQDKKNLFLLIKFLAIAIQYGPDRALRSLQTRDNLLLNNTRSRDQNDDLYNSIMFEKGDISTRIPALQPARRQYYQNFRFDGFNPFQLYQITSVGLEDPFSQASSNTIENPHSQVDPRHQQGSFFAGNGNGSKAQVPVNNPVKEAPYQGEDRRNLQQQQQVPVSISSVTSSVLTGTVPKHHQQQQQQPRQQQQTQQQMRPQQQQRPQQQVLQQPQQGVLSLQQARQEQEVIRRIQQQFQQQLEEQNRANSRSYYANLGPASADEQRGINVYGTDTDDDQFQQPIPSRPSSRSDSRGNQYHPAPPTMASWHQRKKSLIISDSEDDSDYSRQLDNNSRMSNSSRRINFSRQNFVYQTDDDYTDDPYDACSPDPPPVTPMHFDSRENPYYDQPLSKTGFIQSGRRSYRTTPQKKTGILGSAFLNLTGMGYSQQEAERILSTSVGVAQSISSLLDEKKQHNKSIIKHIPPPPSDQDFRLRSFDYKRDGTTPEEILGRRFRHTRFPSDAIRLQVMKEIFQAVVMDQLSSVQAYKIAQAQLANIDVPKIRKQEIQQCLATSMRGPEDDEDLIPPPLLGSNALDGPVLKTVQTRILLDKTFDMNNLSRGAFRSFLTNLSSVISNAGLREEEAYALLRQVTTGATKALTESSEFEHRLPFAEYWVSLQKTQRRSSSTKQYEKQLDQILKGARTENVEAALNDIVILNEKIHARETDASVRKFLCQRKTLKDLRFYIRKHYPSYISQINTLFTNKLVLLECQKNIKNFTNENLYHPGKTFAFLEIACEILAFADPDEQLTKPQQPAQRPNTYVHATSASPVMDGSEQGEQPRRPNTRPQTPAYPPNRGPNNYDRAPSRGGNFNQRPPSRGPGYSRPNDGRRSGFGNRKPNFSCLLCNYPGHSYRECRTYKEQQQTDIKQFKTNPFCNRCGGKHQGQCNTRVKGRLPHEEGPQQQQDQASHQHHTMNVASINAAPPVEQRPQTPVIPQQMQSQPQQQGYPPQRNYTPGPYNNQGNYRNQTPGPYRQDDRQNYRQPYNPNYRPRSGFGQRRYNDYQDRKPRYYNQDGRRSGYDNRGYNRDRYDDRDRRYPRQDGNSNYRQRRYYKDHNSDNPQQFDRSASRQGRSYEQEEHIAYTARTHQQNEKQQGLGNDGFQNIHPSVQCTPLNPAILDSSQNHLSH